MKMDTVSEAATLVVRRLTLAPGEATPWHTDACRRLSVIVSGTKLRIEFRDDANAIEVTVQPGLADWDDPEPRVHRAVNSGSETYQEVVAFFRDSDDIEVQPLA